ncbi:L,D-transpeptidase [Clostridium sp. AM58-1XD]|uniref:L,D-transpeptidase family protein n=1 Tax=Clostridium sp. AM58-1XD TaxID=2292307 RepID=UPI0015F723AB|nr:L,D-transpeptidase [Clostridium sp. AM58-1XD]
MRTIIKNILTLTAAVCMAVSSFTAAFAGEWAQDENGWRYMDDGDLYSANEWQCINDKYYYFNDDGYMLSNMITPDEYWIGNDGYWISDSYIDQEAMAEKSLNGSLIVFDKCSHQMELWVNGERIYSCLGIAGALQGDKDVEGDCKTPVGEFYVCSKNANSQYHKALGLSYPNIEDAERGIAQGLITEAQYKKIVRAIQNGSKPDWYTPLGGEIMIHGKRGCADGTRGCIGILDSDIDYIWNFVTMGTKVIIQEQ